MSGDTVRRPNLEATSEPDVLDSIDAVPTPAVVIEEAIVRGNIDRLAAYAAAHGLAVRPHTKTHKSVRIAGLQLAAGSPGITVAKAGEAEALLPAFDRFGTPDILVAYPAADPARAERIARLARIATIRVAVDTAAAVATVGAAAARAGATVGILVDLDLGMGRTGVPDVDALVALAQVVGGTAGLRLDGIFCYPGQIVARPQEQAGPLAAAAALVAEAVDRFDRAGLCRGIVSGGSTPTAYQSHLMPALTEIRPGTNVFNDLNTLRGGFCDPSDCAATVLATVVSDAVAGQVVLDAGPGGTITAATGTGYTCWANTVSQRLCTRPGIINGATTTITVTANWTAGVHTITATLSTTGTIDPDPSDNSATRTVAVT